ncbi:MAG: hypothetical protein ABL971_03365 [Vicinamibacterales bacterium]
MRNDETVLWTVDGPPPRACVMISCCSGAELQIREDEAIVLREIYPDKSTLYERAEQLRPGPRTEGA